VHDVLLTVSGHMPADVTAQVAAGARPEPDYLALARGLAADLLDYGAARRQAGWLGRMLARLGGPNLLLAWVCFEQRRRYRVLFTDGEQVGLPLAVLLRLWPGRRPRHVMIAHRLSVRKKRILLDWLGLARWIDVFVVYSPWQKRLIEARWRVPPQQVVFTPFMVDAAFFTPQFGAPACGAVQRPLLCAVGLEYRDYPTLIEAVRGLDVDVVIAADSPWSKRTAELGTAPLPPNVSVSRYSQFELRALYARSCLVVMPLLNVDFQAGITGLLEAMAMGKPVICSRTQGETGVICDRETGYCVEAGHPAALRSLIEYVLANPEEAEAVGQRAREFVMRKAGLPRYVEMLREVVVSVS
jgi:glycosyltransferase involved in cell wall biosynthesis